MVSNTGTYLDTPFHRFADGDDLAGVTLARVAALPGVRVRSEAGAIGADAFAGVDVRGHAVLIHTGWDRHWRTEAYFAGHPFLTEKAAAWLVEAGAAMVGIDSHNIDDTAGDTRPVHTRLLGAGIPICEHVTGLGSGAQWNRKGAQGSRHSSSKPEVFGLRSGLSSPRATISGSVKA